MRKRYVCHTCGKVLKPKKTFKLIGNGKEMHLCGDCYVETVKEIRRLANVRKDAG